MKICIFGGNGFIGSSLAKTYINNGHKVFVYSQTKINKNLNFKNNYKVNYNEKSFAKILKKNFDLIYFLSGNSNQETSKKDIYYDLETSFLTFVELLEASKKSKSKSRIWFASSVVVYGVNNKPLREDFELNPVSNYAIIKLICENICKFYSKNFNLNIGIMRIFSTFGPGLKRQVVFDTIRKIRTLKNFKVIGSGNEKRNFAYIDDQVKSIMLLTKKFTKPRGEIFNIASGKTFSIKQILKKLIKISNKNVAYTYTKKRRSFDTKNFIANNSKIVKIIGKQKYANINNALKKTFDSF
jgi:UDP-glucose 4-epimerase